MLGFETKLSDALHLPFFVVIERLTILRVILVRQACEAERLASNPLDFSQLVEVHLAQIHKHIVLFYLPVQRKAVRYLEECFEIVWHLVGGIVVFPLGY